MTGGALPGGGERVRHILLITFRPDTPQARAEAVMYIFCRLPSAVCRLPECIRYVYGKN